MPDGVHRENIFGSWACDELSDTRSAKTDFGRRASPCCFKSKPPHVGAEDLAALPRPLLAAGMGPIGMLELLLPDDHVNPGVDQEGATTRIHIHAGRWHAPALLLQEEQTRWRRAGLKEALERINEVLPSDGRYHRMRSALFFGTEAHSGP